MKTIAPEDLQVGMIVSAMRVRTDPPPRPDLPYIVPDWADDWRRKGPHPARSTADPGLPGEPMLVVGVDLPFVRLTHCERPAPPGIIVNVGDCTFGTFAPEMFDDFTTRIVGQIEQASENKSKSDAEIIAEEKRLSELRAEVRRASMYDKRKGKE